MSTPSNFWPGTSTYNKMFTDILADRRAVEPFVIEQYPQLTFFNRLTQALGNAELIKSGQRKFEIYRQGNTYPAASIATRTANADGTLTLTWDDPNFASLRVGNGVAASNGTWGIVVDKIPGQARLMLYYSASGSTTFQAGDFVVNSMASDRGDLSNVVSSGSKERLIFKPFDSYNLVGQMRDTAELSYDEMNTLTFIDNVNGTPYYALTAVMDMLQNAAKTVEVRTISAPRVDNPNQPIGGGFAWQIQNQGGTYYPIYNEVDEITFQTFIDQMIQNNGQLGDEILVVCGSNFMGAIQRNVLKGLIQYPGQENTVGGVEVKGINAKVYAYNGKTLKFVVNPLFNDSQAFPTVSTIIPGTLTMSHSAFFFDTTQVMTKGGRMPFMRKYYFGSSDIIMSKINGLVSIDGQVIEYPSSSSLSGKQEIVYNCTTQLMNPAAHGFMFLAA